MSEAIKKTLAKHSPNLPPEKVQELCGEFDAISRRMAELIHSIDPNVPLDLLREMPACLQQELYRLEIEAIKATTEKITPEILEWAQQDFNEEEFMDDIREIQRTGGLQLCDFIDELKQMVAGHE